METGDCMAKPNHVLIQIISPFPICLNSSQPAIINHGNMETGDCMAKTNHVLIQNIFPFPICLNSSQPAIINQRWKMPADILED